MAEAAGLLLPNTMKRLLKVTTLLEAPTGLALIVAPAFVVRLLLRAEISGAAAGADQIGREVRKAAK